MSTEDVKPDTTESIPVAAPAVDSTPIDTPSAVQKPAAETHSTKEVAPAAVTFDTGASQDKSASGETAVQTSQDATVSIEEPGSETPVCTKTVTPVFSAQIAYRRSTATFPILHQRWFWQQDEPIALEHLQSLYVKMQKLKMSLADAHDMIAHAATTGKGLLFWAKTEDSAAPSGLLNIAQITDLEEGQGTNRATFRYSKDVSYTFEFASNDIVSSFVLGLKLKQDDFVGQQEAIFTSDVFKRIRESLVDGTAFNKPNSDVEEQVLSDEEATPNTEARPENNRSSSILGMLKSKTEDNKEAVTTKKEKRASFLGFLNKKEPLGGVKTDKTTTADAVTEPAVVQPIETAPDPVVVPKDGEVPPAVEDKSPEKGKHVATPAKEKVEGFFRNLIKRNEKSEDAVKTDATSPTEPKLMSESPAPVETTSSVVAPEVAAPLEHDTAPALAQDTSKEDKSMVPPSSTSPRPFPGGSMTRRLTGLFKAKSKKETPKAEAAVAPDMTNAPVAQEAPILPMLSSGESTTVQEQLDMTDKALPVPEPEAATTVVKDTEVQTTPDAPVSTESEIKEAEPVVPVDVKTPVVSPVALTDGATKPVSTNA